MAAAINSDSNAGFLFSHTNSDCSEIELMVSEWAGGCLSYLTYSLVSVRHSH